MKPTDETPVIFADRVQSLNYDGPDGAEVFADAGTLIDLATGSIISTAVSVDGITGIAQIAATLVAADGTFTGDLVAAGGTFTGDLSAAGGTFTGELVAASGSFSGTVSADTFTLTDDGTTVLQLGSRDIYRGAPFTTTVNGLGNSDAIMYVRGDEIGLNSLHDGVREVGLYLDPTDSSGIVRLYVQTPGFGDLNSAVTLTPTAVTVVADNTITLDAPSGTTVVGPLNVTGALTSSDAQTIGSFKMARPNTRAANLIGTFTAGTWRTIDLGSTGTSYGGASLNGAKAVVLHIAVVNAAAAGFIELKRHGGTDPNGSSLNYDAGGVRSTLAMVEVDSSMRFQWRVNGGTVPRFVVDVVAVLY